MNQPAGTRWARGNWRSLAHGNPLQRPSHDGRAPRVTDPRANDDTPLRHDDPSALAGSFVITRWTDNMLMDRAPAER
jgi:hypothetical protein